MLNIDNKSKVIDRIFIRTFLIYGDLFAAALFNQLSTRAKRIPTNKSMLNPLVINALYLTDSDQEETAVSKFYFVVGI
jgi:hypothetical protein